MAIHAHGLQQVDRRLQRPLVDGGEQILYRFQEAAAQRFLGGAVEGVLATVDRKPP
jgi:hypothetical protein